MQVVSTLRLTVTGTRPENRLNLVLVDGDPVRIGRAPSNGWAVPWDLAISREHADLCWEDGQLRVTCLPAARNSILHRTTTSREVVLKPGDSFRIGKTTFEATKEVRELRAAPDTVELDSASDAGMAPEEMSYSAEDLKKVAFRNSDQQLEILSRLPALIGDTASDEELQQMISDLLLEAIPQAHAVAVTHYEVTQLPETEAEIAQFPRPLTMRVKTRDDGAASFRPSRRIILRTLQEQASVLYTWQPESGSELFTMTEGMHWAFCAPIRDRSSRGWCLYVSGKGGAGGGFLVSRSILAADLRFTELVAQFIGSVHQVRSLQEKQTRLSSFFSPTVINSLVAEGDVNILTPAEREITVLFCDVRGFSRRSEELQDELLTLLESVREALSVMVEGIMEHEGAIADFQGDAALGFWGWPVAQPDGPIPACLAAIRIYSQFRNALSDSESRLSGFSVGIGIAHGRAVAGQIGTDRQSKIGVFGPVVNQGARLEGMTKKFGVPVCIDGKAAQSVRQHLTPSDGRLRRLAVVRPSGMTESVEVYALLPPFEQFPAVTDDMIAIHENALDLLIAGRWDEALKVLRQLPAEDGPRRFLLRKMKALGKAPPPDWDGVFNLESK